MNLWAASAFAKATADKLPPASGFNWVCAGGLAIGMISVWALPIFNADYLEEITSCSTRFVGTVTQLL